MDRLEELKRKYQTVLKTVQEKGARLQNLHVQDNKLFVKGAAPSEAVKNLLWDQVKIIDPGLSDLTLDITIDPSLAPAAETYTVVAGDTLSKISKKFYGDANKYMRIFEANRDKLSDPDKIKVGQVLTIPK